jgi:uncharacterized protein (TIGR02145 family)
MKKNNQYMTFILNVRNTLTTMSKYKLLKSILLILLLNTIGAQDVMAQLSSKHYLPPLKQTSNVVQGQAIYLSTPETTAFDVNIYLGTNTTAVATLSVSNSSPGIYTPPLGSGGSTVGGENNTTLITGANAGIVLSSAGLRFEAPSGKKFYVNWRSAQGGQASSLVSAGIAGLGTDFRWVGIPQIITSGEAGYQGANSVIGIMATEDNTTVTISGYNPACTFTKNNNISGVNSITDDVINITLSAGQSYVLEAVAVYNTINVSGWLGATISSNKNIAVNQGHLMFKLQSGGIDFSMTQLTPTANIGKEYVFIRANGVDDVEFPVIIATQNNTDIFINNELTPYATLNNGEWVKIPATKYSQSSTAGNIAGANMFVKASKDVYAVQSISAGPSGALIDMFQVAPLNCLLDNGINNIPDVVKTGLTGTTLTSCGIIVLASSAISESNIAINYGTGSVNTVPTSTLTSAKKSVLGTSDWVSYYIPSLTGDIKVNATGPVAVGYFGVSGVAGVAAYFSGFGTIPTIEVQSTGNGCFPNTTLTATPGFTTYAWYKDGVLLPSVTTNTFTPTVAGDYYVVVYNGFCTYPSATKSVYDCNPEVIVTNTASDNYLLPGETTVFTIKVKLLGGSAAQNLQISNVIPTHLTYTSSTVTKGTFSGSGSNYTWNVGTMTNGEENILRVTATAQSVTSGFSETYITNNTQTFALGTEANNLADDKNETVVIYSGCSSSLAGTILGATSYCTTTNSTTLTASNAVGDLQWQSSSDNINFTNISGATASTLLVTNLAATTYYRVQTTVDTCVEYATPVSIAVSQGPAYSLTSASGTETQTRCINTNITPITYSTTNTTGVSFSGLPSGITGVWTNNTVTISGSTSATGTFNYSINLVGTCTVTIPGSITVSNTNNTIFLTSATGTNTQSIDNNVAISSITYNTTGATGASFSGLPMGITGTWTNNTISIAGTPTTSGVYNYTISLTGGCGTVSTSGTITVKGVTITSNISGSSICEGTSVTFTATAIGFTSPTYQWYKNGVAIVGANSSTYSTTTLSNNDIIKVTCSTAPNLVNDNSLKLWLDASNTSSYTSGTTWNDLSGNNNNATLINNASFDPISKSIMTNGIDQYISVPLFNSSITNITMQTWVYINANSHGGFMSNGTSSYSIGIGSNVSGEMNNNGNQAWMLFSGVRYINTNSTYSTGWHLVTMTMDANATPSYYLDGAFVYTSPGSLPNIPTDSFNLGAVPGDGPKFYNGKFAAAYFYNRVLSANEILQNYNATVGTIGGVSASSYSSNTITTIITTPSVTITSSASGSVCAGTAITFTATVDCITTPIYQWTKNGIAIPGATSSTYSSTSLSNNDVIKVWINAGIDNSAIVSNGLLLNLDASNPGSYSGSGNNWYDLSGNNNHATLMNNPNFDATSGSIVTNGTNQYISVPQVSTANTNITMQAWVYVNLNTTGTFIKNGTGGGGYSIGIGNWAYDQVGSNVVMLLYGQGWIGSGVSYGTAGWKLVTLTLDGSSTARAYVNGSLIGTYTWPTPTSPSGPLNLGANIGDGNIYYNGKFAAAYFYNRALSLAEILQNYNAFATKKTGYGSNTITISLNGSVPTITVFGDSCINKTTLSTTSGLTSYTWYKDNVIISGANTNTYTPTIAGDYKVEVSNGTCTTVSSATSISICGLTAEGKMIPIENSTTLVSKDGATNSGKGLDERGLIISKPIYYGTVTTGTGRIWLDRNLGASRVATSATDIQAFGDYYQWGRPADGHQTQYITNNNSTGFTNTKSTTSVPPNSLWIKPNDGSEDWLITANNTLWVGANPPNNPCPLGFRIPTLSEWQAEQALFTSNNSNGAFNYSLKLTMPGWLENFDNNGAGFIAKSSGGFYLTQTANSNGSVQYFGINSGNVWADTNLTKRRGLSCRCIKD